ncbi:hypothetical protein TrST_g4146 [Triparma strigata]|uniref:Uncharacterized protein n=1 Tax=Triparma strigata TaxID=1606541 RepID=A0A9W7DU33_9STRA|nr:hypothetical protein TrST_g4146 [Triparma strigata]
MLLLVDSTAIPTHDPDSPTGFFTGSPITPGSDIVLCTLSSTPSRSSRAKVSGTFSTASLGLSLQVRKPSAASSSSHTILQYCPEDLPPNFDFSILQSSPPPNVNCPEPRAPQQKPTTTNNKPLPNATLKHLRLLFKNHPRPTLLQILLDTLLFLPLPYLLPHILPHLLNLPQTLNSTFFSKTSLSFLANNPLGIKMNPELSVNLSNEIGLLTSTTTSFITSLLSKIPPSTTPTPHPCLFLLAPFGLSTTLSLLSDVLYLLTLPTRLAYFLCRAISLSTLWLLRSLYKLTSSVKVNPLRERSDTYIAADEMELLLIVTSLVILLFLVTTVTTFHAYAFASYSVAEALRLLVRTQLVVLLSIFDAVFQRALDDIPCYSVSYKLMVPNTYKLHGSEKSKLSRCIILIQKQIIKINEMNE